MKPTQVTVGSRPPATRWMVPFGLLAGAGVMALVWVFLTAVDPDSDAAWLGPIFGIPAALVVAALVPVEQGRSFRIGMALGSLLLLAVFIGYLVASAPYA